MAKLKISKQFQNMPALATSFCTKHLLDNSLEYYVSLNTVFMGKKVSRTVSRTRKKI